MHSTPQINLSSAEGSCQQLSKAQYMLISCLSRCWFLKSCRDPMAMHYATLPTVSNTPKKTTSGQAIHPRDMTALLLTKVVRFLLLDFQANPRESSQQIITNSFPTILTFPRRRLNSGVNFSSHQNHGIRCVPDGILFEARGGVQTTKYSEPLLTEATPHQLHPCYPGTQRHRHFPPFLYPPPQSRDCQVTVQTHRL